MGFCLEECIPTNEFVFIETAEGTSTGVRAEEKARQRPTSSFPRGLERVEKCCRAANKVAGSNRQHFLLPGSSIC